MSPAAPVAILLLVAIIFHEDKPTKIERSNKKEIEEIKKTIEAMQAQIKVIKIIKKDMDEKEWEIKL